MFNNLRYQTMTSKFLLSGIAILLSVTSLASVPTGVGDIAEPIDTTLSLQEVVVRGYFQNENRTPLNLSTISHSDLVLHSTSSNYLEIMQNVPGVYATSSTGTYGDATLNMRGFKQENISIMLNGIPIQGLTSGSMYWSNWMGLSEATYAVQIQKGLGGSMLADCAMGGMVNIVTKRGTSAPSLSISSSASQYGTLKSSLNYSSGLLPGGWGVDLTLSGVTGSGYVECSDVKTLSYMVGVSKLLGARNTLVFTALGSPEQHDQRNTELSIDEVNKYGRDYSKNWGLLRGKEYSIGRNHYIKPYFTLQHFYEGDRISMKNSIYLALADGGGRSTYAASGAKNIISHQTSDGHIDFDSIIRENQESGASKNIMIDYLSGHTQAGAIFSMDYRQSNALTLSTGAQYQYYDTWSKMNVLDLLGGEYWYDYSTKSQLKVGDHVGSMYGRTTHHTSGYFQGKFDNGPWNANLGVSVFHGFYRRHNDLTGEVSDWASGFGLSVKSGILREIGDSQAVYFNAGFNSRLPYASVYLASSNLSLTNDVVNEKNLLAEAGYRAHWEGGSVEISGYLASWKDKTLTVSLSKRANEQSEKYQITGLDAIHKGIELSANQRLASWLDASAFATFASWKWASGGDAIIYDTFSGEALKSYSIYCDGLHVGDAPQTQIGASFDAKSQKGFYANLSWRLNARMYADFEPSSRTSVNPEDAYMFPTYNIVDSTIGWEGKLTSKSRINVFLTGRNLTDTFYIERGTDGANHDLSTFRGYWGAARNFSLGLRIIL